MSETPPPPPPPGEDEQPPPPPPLHRRPAAATSPPSPSSSRTGSRPRQPYGQPPAQPYGQPYGQPYAQQYGQPYAQPYAQPYGQPPANNQKAVWAMVLGIVGLLCCAFAGIAAIILGKQAQNEIDASGGVQGGRGMATAGFVLGIIALVAWVVIVIFYVVVLGVAASSNG